MKPLRFAQKARIERLVAAGKITAFITWEPVTWEYQHWLETQRQQQITERVAQKHALSSLRQILGESSTNPNERTNEQGR